MPTYSYACTVCEHRFEAQQSFTDSSLTVCPECSGRLRKIFPSVGVVFKGSGFYRNDSRSGNGGKVPAGATSSNGESGSSGSSESGDSPAASPAATPSAPAAATSGNVKSGTGKSGNGKSGGSSGSAKVGASSGAAAASS